MPLLLWAVAVSNIWGHGSLLWPPPRNAVDRNLPAWSGGKFPAGHYNCECTNATHGACDPGQACLWMNQGCSIHCPCTGNGTASRIAGFNSCNTRLQASNNDPATRTINRYALAGSAEDVTKFMPWRAPGTAILMDSCGVAGGGPAKQNFGGEFITTPFATLGDLGSKVLKPQPYGVKWSPGEIVNVSLFIKANHAGGWQFRLCPVSEDLNEDCFQKTPIPFEGEHQFIQLSDGFEQRVNATYLSTPTHDNSMNSTWIVNPFPECCPAKAACAAKGLLCGSSVSKECSNHECGHDGGFGPSVPEFPWPLPTSKASETNLPTKMSIVNTLRIPTSIVSGDYVLGWRWDCEETGQVWTACADVTVA